MVADFYRVLIERSPHVLALIGADGTHRWSSPAARDLFGSDADRRLTDIVEKLETEQPEPVEISVPAADGSWRTLSVLTRDLPAVGGTAFYAVDVTRAHAAERRARVDA